MKLYGNLDLRNSGKSRFFGSGSNFVSLQAPAGQAVDVAFTLPGSDLASGVLQSKIGRAHV